MNKLEKNKDDGSCPDLGPGGGGSFFGFLEVFCISLEQCEIPRKLNKSQKSKRKANKPRVCQLSRLGGGGVVFCLSRVCFLVFV